MPVLVDEVLTFLTPTPGGTYVDGTLGGGGHAEHMLSLCGPDGTLIGFDQDGDAPAYTYTWYLNGSPDGSEVTDTFPAAIVSPTWTCGATAGSSCTAMGSGNTVLAMGYARCH